MSSSRGALKGDRARKPYHSMARLGRGRDRSARILRPVPASLPPRRGPTPGRDPRAGPRSRARPADPAFDADAAAADRSLPARPSAAVDPALDTDALAAASAALGVALDGRQLPLYERYAAALAEWNRRLNLTRIEGPTHTAVGHFADSLACLVLADPAVRGLDRAPRCVDIGSGAGLPGLALAIARPGWRWTLVEATAKKALFLTAAIELLELANVEVVEARVEIVGHAARHREAFDLAVARAVAATRVLAEYALPLLCVGGRLVALKGREGAAEAAAAAAALEALGGELGEVRGYDLPGTPGRRSIVAVDKVRPTPSGYPRRPGIPSKRPL